MSQKIVNLLQTLFSRSDMSTEEQKGAARYIIESYDTEESTSPNTIEDDNITEEYLPFIEIADRYGYTSSGVRSAVDNPKNNFDTKIRNNKRCILPREWETYMREKGYGKHRSTQETSISKNNLLHRGGSSLTISNYEIKSWMTIPQCAEHLAVDKDDVERLITKGKVTIYSTATGRLVNANEIRSLLRNLPLAVPDLTVFDRWKKISLLADDHEISASILTPKAKKNEIASHRIGSNLYVHIGEVENILYHTD